MNECSQSISLFTSGLDKNGLPLITMDGLRLATSDLFHIQAHKWDLKDFPPWISTPYKNVYNTVFKKYYAAYQASEFAFNKLKAHHDPGTFPQLVLAVYPGCTSIHIDRVLSDDTRSLLLVDFENMTRVAHRSMLEHFIVCKRKALEEHQKLSSPLYVALTYKNQVLDNMLAIGQSLSRSVDL